MFHFLSSFFTLFSSPSFWLIFKRAITLLCLFLFICSLSSSPSKSCHLRFLSPIFSSLPLTGFKILFTGEESRKSVICIFGQACMVMEHFTVRRGNCLTLQHRGSGVAIDCTTEGERSCLILHQKGVAAALLCTREGEQLPYAAPERGSSCLTLHQRGGGLTCAALERGSCKCCTRKGELPYAAPQRGSCLCYTRKRKLLLYQSGAFLTQHQSGSSPTLHQGESSPRLHQGAVGDISDCNKVGAAPTPEWELSYAATRVGAILDCNKVGAAPTPECKLSYTARVGAILHCTWGEAAHAPEWELFYSSPECQSGSYPTMQESGSYLTLHQGEAVSAKEWELSYTAILLFTRVTKWELSYNAPERELLLNQSGSYPVGAILHCIRRVAALHCTRASVLKLQEKG